MSPPKEGELSGIRGTANKVREVKQVVVSRVLSVSKELFVRLIKLSSVFNHIKVGLIITFTFCPVKPHLFVMHHFTLVACTFTFAKDQNRPKVH